MPIWSFCEEKLEELAKAQVELQQVIDYYSSATEEELWLKDIDEFAEAWRTQRSGI